MRNLLHRRFNFIGDVRNHLHRFSQVVAAALLGDDLFVDAAGRPVIVAGEPGVGKPFVVAQVEIGLRAIIGDKDFSMLERGHRPGIDVEVGIELLQVHLQPAAFEETSDGSRRQSLAQGRHNTAGHKYEFC